MMEKENDFEKFEALLQSKSYHELTPQELQCVNQWLESAQEYEALRASGKQVASWFGANAVSTTSKETLQQLKHSLRVQHQRTHNVWYKPVWGYAVTALVFGVLGWWVGQPQIKPEPVTLVEQVIVHDTLYIASNPDTVFREKIIYRDRPVILTTQTRQPESKNEKGVSMKEKEELDKLLVSGSE